MSHEQVYSCVCVCLSVRETQLHAAQLNLEILIELKESHFPF